MSRNMTRGNPLKLIMLFMLPLLAGNVFQQLYNMADTFIVGRTLGVQALAAVGSTGSIMFFILGFAQGATAGLSIITAQHYGAGDKSAVRRSFAAGVLITAVITVTLTALSLVFARGFLQLLGTPADIMEDAYSYTIVIFWGIAAIMLFNLLSNVIRSVGDSRSPLVFLVIACLLNIALDYFLILVVGMGVAGAAVATVVAQAVSGLLCVWYIRRRLPELWPGKGDWLPTRAELSAHLRSGLPMGFQSSVIAIGSLTLQYALNGLGTDAVAAFTAAGKLEQFGALPLSSFGITMATFSAQNYGAGELKRIFKGVRQCTLVSMGFALAAGLTFYFAGGALSQAFVGNAPHIVEMSHQYLKYVGVCLPMLGLLFILRYTLQGLGHSMVPTLAGVMELVMRSLAAIVLTAAWGYAGACLAGPLAWFGALLPLGAAFLITRRRLLKTVPGHGQPADYVQPLPGPPT